MDSRYRRPPLALGIEGVFLYSSVQSAKSILGGRVALTVSGVIVADNKKCITNNIQSFICNSGPMDVC